MIYMKSVSGNDGSYSLLLSFELGTDADINTVNVNNRVQVALSKLPADVRTQGVTVKKQSSALLGVISLYSPKHTRDELFISNYATINLIDSIRSTAGVGDARLFGPQDYAMRVWLQTDRMTGLGLAVSDVIGAIQSQNTQAPVGRIGARPVDNDQQIQLNIETKGRLASVEEFQDIIIRTNPDGSVLKLRDFSRVELGAANMDRATRLNGAGAALIAVYQSPGANAITSLGAVKKLLAESQKDFPEDLAWKVTYDPTTFVTATIHEVQKTLIEAFILVVLVVYLFLGSFRATLIPAIAVPVSLIGAFAVLLVLGYSANTVSLLAMVLAIGIVVDDAIVVVENVERVMVEEPDLSPAEATKKAMAQITAPIIAITLVLLSVFVPIAFIPGISGTLFRQFAVTISAAMVISALNALTLSPALCAVFLRHTGPRRGILGRVLGGIDWVRDRYTGGVRRLLRMGALSLVLVLLFAGGIFGVARLTPTGFLPEEDQGAFFIAVQLPDGASVARTSEVTKQVEAMLKGIPAIDHVLSIIGFSLLDGGSEPNSAFIVARMKPFADRKAAADSVQATIRKVFAAGSQIRQANILPFNLPPIIGLSTSGGFEYQLEALEGQDPAALGSVMGGLVAAANRDPRLARVFSTFTATNPSIYLDIDRAKAQALGLNISDVFTALQATLGGIYVNNFNLFGRTWQVNVQAEASDRSDFSDIWRIYVRNATGDMVPIRSI